MRDPARIDKFCERLAAVWHKVLDQRFGQFIVNVLGESKRDPFFLEDDEMIEFIEKTVDGWFKNE